MFSVSDTGIGIAPQHIPRLTERFTASIAAARAGTGGTGLGLAIVKHVLARHHARLDVHSARTLERGSTFSVWFNADHLRADGVSIAQFRPLGGSRRPAAQLRIFAYCLRPYPVLS